MNQDLVWLVVWNIFIVPYIGNVIIPIDELIFFRGVAQPPTSCGCSCYFFSTLWGLHDPGPRRIGSYADLGTSPDEELDELFADEWLGEVNGLGLGQLYSPKPCLWW